MSAKVFLSYQNQIDKLNNEKGLQVKGIISREYLVRYGYFNLVNGYKDFFCNSVSNERTYYSNIKIDQLKDVMNFDKNLRKILYRYVTQIEEEIGSIFGYIFERDLSAKSLNWGDMSLYSSFEKKTGREILSRIYSDISKRDNDYMKHYEMKHSYLPTWIMIKAISFGNLIKLIINTDPSYKKELCDLYSVSYSFPDFRKLTTMLSLINALRNNIAHSERIIDFKGNPDKKRTLTQYHRTYGYTKVQQERLIDVLLYMKMFIPGKEYIHLVNEIITMFDQLKLKVHNNAFIKICSSFGLITSINYKTSLIQLKTPSHTINYSILI